MLASKLVYVNSELRSSGTSSNFTFRIGMPEQRFDRVCVLQMSIPQSYYIIDEVSQTFILRELGIDTVVTVPVGNYNVTTFASVVTGLLNTASPNLWTYKMSFPNTSNGANTGKFNFTVTGNGTDQPSFKFPNEIHEQFGFDLHTYYPFSANVLQSLNVVSFIPETRVFLHSDIGINYDDGDSVLQEVYAGNTVPMSVISYQLTTHPDAYSKAIRSDTNNIYHFWLTNKSEDAINLNGQDILITLLLYKKDNFTDIFKKYIQLQLLQNERETPPT